MVSLTSLAPAFVGVSRAALALRVRGFAASCGRYLRAPEGAITAHCAAGADLAEPYRLSAVLPWSTCLTRSVALCRHLRRRALPAILRIGTARDDRGLKAHAGVELDGRVINDSPAVAAAFAPLPAPGGPRS